MASQGPRLKVRNDEISVFVDEPASANQIAVSVKKLSIAFPDMSPEFFNLLAESLSRNRFTGKRLAFAVNKVIDSFNYKRLNIADVVSIDKKCKMFTYQEVANLIDKGDSFDNYAAVKNKTGKTFWVKKTDKIQFDIPDEI